MPITLAFVGDIMLGRMVDQEIPDRTPKSFWGTVLPVLRAADAVFGNLECAISARGTRHGRIHKVFTFRARPEAVDILRAGRVSCVSLANNHVLDYGDEALADTLRHLDDAGIAHAGAGATPEDAMAPAVVDAAGRKVGFIAITDNEPAFAATPGRPGTCYMPITTDQATLAQLRRQIDQLRRDGASLIVLSAHWGPNMVDYPPPAFRKFARAVVDLGVAVFHGHSAHCFQGVERHGSGLILYDTGDFIDDYAVDPVLRNDWSFVFLVEIDDQGPKRLRMLPVRLNVARVDLAEGQEAARIKSLMRDRCEALHVRPDDARDGLVLESLHRSASSDAAMRATDELV